jgi:hypothetical protein
MQAELWMQYILSKENYFSAYYLDDYQFRVAGISAITYGCMINPNKWGL